LSAADAGFGFAPVLEMLEARPAEYAVVAQNEALRRALGGLLYECALGDCGI
jgi:hypothetical protein